MLLSAKWQLTYTFFSFMILFTVLYNYIRPKQVAPAMDLHRMQIDTFCHFCIRFLSALYTRSKMSNNSLFSQREKKVLHMVNHRTEEVNIYASSVCNLWRDVWRNKQPSIHFEVYLIPEDVSRNSVILHLEHFEFWVHFNFTSVYLLWMKLSH